MSIQMARGIAVEACRNGCPVVTLTDADHAAFAVVHISPDALEQFIKLLREAAAEGEALQRPTV